MSIWFLKFGTSAGIVLPGGWESYYTVSWGSWWSCATVVWLHPALEGCSGPYFSSDQPTTSGGNLFPSPASRVSLSLSVSISLFVSLSHVHTPLLSLDPNTKSFQWTQTPKSHKNLATWSNFYSQLRKSLQGKNDEGRTYGSRASGEDFVRCWRCSCSRAAVGRFPGNQRHSLIFILSVAAFMLQRQSWVVMPDRPSSGRQSLKYLLSDLLTSVLGGLFHLWIYMLNFHRYVLEDTPRKHCL